MQLYEMVIGMSGTAVGGAIVGKWLNKKRDTLENQLKEQVFYKTLIADIQTQSNADKKEIQLLKTKIDNLTKKVTELLKLNREKDEIIADQRKNVLRWEQNCERLEQIIKQEQKKVAKLFTQLEAYEKRNGQIDRN